MNDIKIMEATATIDYFLEDVQNFLSNLGYDQGSVQNMMDILKIAKHAHLAQLQVSAAIEEIARRNNLEL